jgi:hypothetical protein
MSPVNNENFETLSENIWDNGICIEYIPDGHAFITFLFLETTLVPHFFKWSLKIICTYTNSDRILSFLVFVKCYIITN